MKLETILSLSLVILIVIMLAVMLDNIVLMNHILSEMQPPKPPKEKSFETLQMIEIIKGQIPLINYINPLHGLTFDIRRPGSGGELARKLSALGAKQWQKSSPDQADILFDNNYIRISGRCFPKHSSPEYSDKLTSLIINGHQ